MDTLPEGLLSAVKNYLDITWTDTDTDTKITGIIYRGMKDLDKTAGHALDYSVEDSPRGLLMDYCRYARDNALDQFKINYAPDLMALMHEYAIKYFATLTSISIGAMTLSPAFNPLTFEYTAAAENDSDIILALAYQEHAVIALSLDGADIENGGIAEWAIGENLLAIAVTMGTVTKTYSITVTKS